LRWRHATQKGGGRGTKPGGEMRRDRVPRGGAKFPGGEKEDKLAVGGEGHVFHGSYSVKSDRPAKKSGPQTRNRGKGPPRKRFRSRGYVCSWNNNRVDNQTGAFLWVQKEGGRVDKRKVISGQKFNTFKKVSRLGGTKSQKSLRNGVLAL